MESPRSLRILFVEDDPADAELLLRALREGGFPFTVVRVETEAEFRAQLTASIDAIISDHRLPSFDGLHALALRNELRPEVPFILVSGTIGEERAVEAMRQGATDYLIKDRLARLGPAVAQAIEKADLHRAQKTAMVAQLSRIRLLNQIASAIAARKNLDDIHRAVVGNLEEHLPADFACICLQKSEIGHLVVGAVGPRSAPLAAQLGLRDRALLPLEPDDLATCLTGHLLYRTRTAIQGRRLPESFATAGLGALLVVPMITEAKVDTAIVVARLAPAHFSDAECEFLRQVAEHAALAANQAALHAELRHAYDDLRRSQEAAMQQERLRALGQMASGIAHDINNAICVVGIYSELLLAREPNLSAEARDSLETIHRAIQDVGHTVARLREFYRQREPQANLLPVSLNRLVAEIGSLTRARWSDIPQQRGIIIHFQTEIAPALPDVLGVESEIREALTNLVFNSIDAMPAGGTVTIRTRLLGGGEKPGHARLALEVADTGLGMDEDTRRHCLDPFYTTKGERGTGLGLAMVAGIAQRHQAQIEIESEPGRGTTFRLIFDAPATAAASARPAPVEAPSPPRRVLVIDDEAAIAQAVARVLETDGHRVQAATSGHAGVEAFATAHASSEPFEIVFTDLGMPGMDGTEVARRIKELAPGTPVVMLTGWGQGMIDEDTMPQHVDRVLSKPPRVADIRRAIAAFR